MKKSVLAAIAVSAGAVFAQEVQTEPVVEIQAPAIEVQAPAVEVAPVAEEAPVVEVQAPVVEVQAPVVEVQPPVVEVQPPVVEVQAPVVEVAPVVEMPAPEAPVEEAVEDDGCNLPIWGFGYYGIYSGYQLYGNLVNPEPTLQGYAEVNMSLPEKYGYVGLGVWSNSDLTDRRRDIYGKAFNEWHFMVHYGNTFWFDDDEEWGLDFRSALVWLYYPHRRHDHMRGSSPTCLEWRNFFTLKNPYVEPFMMWAHEYHETNADLIEFGLRRAFEVKDVEGLTLTPMVVFVYRDHRYNWCFPTAGFREFHNGGLATGRIALKANYRLTDNFSLFADIGFSSTIDRSLRRAADHGHGSDYSKYKDFAYGAVGLAFKF